jgi:hypothetical protein
MVVKVYKHMEKSCQLLTRVGLLPFANYYTEYT